MRCNWRSRTGRRECVLRNEDEGKRERPCRVVNSEIERNAHVGAWLSLVERLVRDQEVGGSNPLAPTIYLPSFQIITAAGSFCSEPLFRVTTFVTALTASLDALSPDGSSPSSWPTQWGSTVNRCRWMACSLPAVRILDVLQSAYKYENLVTNCNRILKLE